MIRKLIYLPQDLDYLIELTAQAEKKPKAEVIREKLRAGFAAQKQTTNKGYALLEIAKHAVPNLDPHLSANIDKYLYEE